MCSSDLGIILAIIDLCIKDGRKKTCSIIALVVSGLWLVIGVANIGGNDTSPNHSVRTNNLDNTEKTVNTEIDSHDQVTNLSDQIDITEYSMENSIGDTYYILIVKNNSSEVINLSSNATAKDASGKAIGSASASEDAVESGQEICLLHYFDRVTDASEFEYNLSVKKEAFYKPVLSDLSIDKSITDGKVILVVTNNGDKAAKFVEANALFFYEGELVYYGSAYITDDDSEIKSGATISSEIDSYKEFDDVKVYYSGRK